MKILYFDCYAGISGDMILGTLAELGLDIQWITKELQSLPLNGLTLTPKSVRRGALSGTKMEISISDSAKRQGRTLQDFISLLQQSDLPPDIRESAIKIFTKIAQAEAKVHREAIHNIHFHELGSLDSVIDIVGTLVGIKALGIDKIFSSPLHLGSGLITTEHGTIPIPSPATMELLSDIPVYSTGLSYELVTPTGAALISSLAVDFGPMPALRIQKIGYGAGTRDLKQVPNLLRAVLGTTSPDWQEERLSLLETDIDDMNPEFYDYLMTRLSDAGALDVSLTPIIMKKNRPATRLTVLSHPNLIDALCSVIIRETTTLGIRIKEVWRKAIQREIISVPFSFGPVRVKVGKLDGKIVTASPEYEDCRQIALKTKRPLKEIYQEIVRVIPKD